MSVVLSVAILTPLYVCGFWALVFLNSSKRKNKARHFLGFFMATAFLLYLGHSFFFMEHFELYVHYDAVYITSSLMVYPLYYQYIRLLTADTRWSAGYLKHYLPALVVGLMTWLMHHIFHDTSHSNAEIYLREGSRLNFDIRGDYFFYSLISVLHRVVFAIQVVGYFVAGYYLLRNYRERILHYYSSQESRSIRWVAYIFISLIATAILSSVFNILGRVIFLNQPVYLLIPSLLFSTLIFTLGFLANGQDQVVREIALEDQKAEANLLEKVQPNEDIDRRLQDLFRNEKLHLNPDLNIWDVSARLATNRTYLSVHINKKYQVNFSMFVNRFRIEDAKRLLEGEEGHLYSLEVIGEKCGFGSYTNFIRVFREFEQLTPGRYRDQKTGDKN
jgi:AraC-like DNA-binding protein